MRAFAICLILLMAASAKADGLTLDAKFEQTIYDIANRFFIKTDLNEKIKDRTDVSLQSCAIVENQKEIYKDTDFIKCFVTRYSMQSETNYIQLTYLYEDKISKVNMYWRPNDRGVFSGAWLLYKLYKEYKKEKQGCHPDGVHEKDNVFAEPKFLAAAKTNPDEGFLGHFQFVFYDSHDLQNALIKKYFPIEFDMLENATQVGVQIIADPNDEDNYLVRVDYLSGEKLELHNFVQAKFNFGCKQSYFDIGPFHED